MNPAPHTTEHAVIRVWLLEDHEPFRRNILRMLRRAGGIDAERSFGSSEAMLEALNQAAASPPDVLLLDLGLPGTHGLQVIEHLHHRHPACKVIVLTVFEDTEKISRALTGGACGYLLKTATPVEIVAAIHDAADGGAPMSPHVARRVLDLLTTFTRPTSRIRLAPRERDLLRYLVDGLTNKQIAARMGLSIHTVDGYARSLFEKLDVRSRAAAVARAVRDRLVPSPADEEGRTG